MVDSQRAVDERSPAEQDLVLKLVQYLKSKGFDVRAARLDGYRVPPMARNVRSVGNRLDQQPDVYAVEPKDQLAVRGIAKVSLTDLRTEETKTQLLLFSSMDSQIANKKSLLYIIVPTSLREDLNQVLQSLNLTNKPHVIPLASKD